MTTSEKEQSQMEIVERIEEEPKEQTAEVAENTVNIEVDELSKVDVKSAEIESSNSPAIENVVKDKETVVDNNSEKLAIEKKPVEAQSNEKSEKVVDPVIETKENEVETTVKPNEVENTVKSNEAETIVKPNIEGIMEVDSTEIDEERKNLWISNLSNICKAADLKAFFQPIGKVVSAKIFTSRSSENPTCFGYVCLESVKIALECKKKYDRTNFKGKVIAVDLVSRTQIPGSNRPAEGPKQSEPLPKVEAPKSVPVPKVEVKSPIKPVEQPKSIIVEIPAVKTEPSKLVRGKEKIIDDEILSPPVKANEPSKVSAIKAKEQSAKVSTSTKAKDPPAKPSSEKSTEKVSIKASGSSSTSHREHSKSRPDKSTSSRTRRDSPPRNRINSRRARAFNRRPKDSYNKQELNREIKSVAARFSDGKRRGRISPPRHASRRPVNPSPFARPAIGLTQQQPIYSQSDVIRMNQHADAVRKAREDAMERERSRVAMELERERMEKQRLEILKEKQELQIQRMEFQLKQAQHEQQKARDQKYIVPSKSNLASNYTSSTAKDSSKQRYSSPQRRIETYRPTENISGSSRHRTTRSRSPHRSAVRVDRTDRKPEPTRYTESSSSRDRSTRRTNEYYDNRSSTRPSQKEQISGYGNTSSSYSNAIVPQQQTHRQSAKDSTPVYEKRLAAMNDSYKNAGVSAALTSYTRDAYSDRKKDAYNIGLSNRNDAFNSLSYNPADLGTRYAANSTSYSRTLAPSTEPARYDKIYPQTQSYSTPAQPAIQQQQQPSWGASTNAYDAIMTGWPRQSTSDYAVGSNTAYNNVANPSIQYDYSARRF